MARHISRRLGGLSWRDLIQLVNSFLFCVVGGMLVARFILGSAPGAAAVLGGLLLGFGAYRLALAGRELRKRSQNHE